MLKEEVENRKGGRIIVMDSITKLTPDDAGAVVVSASHGGVSSGEFALAFPLTAVFFNDAGVGKDNAGIAALEMLQKKGIAAGTVSHSSARIGDSADMWSNGVISHVNLAAPQARPEARIEPSHDAHSNHFELGSCESLVFFRAQVLASELWRAARVV